MGLFGKKKGIVGIDIGSSALKAVELKAGGKGGSEYQLVNIGMEALPPEAIVDGAKKEGKVVVYSTTDAKLVTPLIKDFVPLADLNDIVFGAWDPIPDDAYTAAKKAGVLEDKHLEPLKDFLSAIKPMPAVFENHYVTRLNGTNVKKGKTKRDLAEQLRQRAAQRARLAGEHESDAFLGQQHGAVESSRLRL